MGSNLNFDATQHQPATPNEPLPNAWYRMHVVESEVKPTADGQGRYLELVFEALDEPVKGRKAWDRLNLQNANVQTVRIAEGQLSALCHAAGVLRLTHSSQLHHIPVMVKLIIKQQPGYDPKNEVRGYKSVNAAAVMAAGAGAAASPFPPNGAAPAPVNGQPPVAQAAPRADAPPWAR